MKTKFAYTNEEDKSYGIAGMLISLNVLDDDFRVLKVSLDSPQGEYITFTPDFFFSGNPRFSAKTAWNEMVKEYQLLTGMVISNIICRHCVHNHNSVDRQMVDDMREIIDEEGRDLCQLEGDEIDVLFRKTLKYMMDVFDNAKVHGVADRFSQTLLQRRTLSGTEILEALR